MDNIKDFLKNMRGKLETVNPSFDNQENEKRPIVKVISPELFSAGSHRV